MIASSPQRPAREREMDSVTSGKINNFLQWATFGIVIIICTVVPFIFFPKQVLYRDMFIMYDSFTYYKSVTQYLLAILSLLILVVHAVLNYIDSKKPGINISISLLLFTIWVTISTFFSESSSTSVFGYVFNHQGLLSHVGYFLFLVLILNLFDVNRVKVFIYAVLASSSVMALLAFSEFLGFTLIEDAFSNASHFRTLVHTTIGNSNRVGSYFSLMAPLAMWMFMRSKGKKETVFFLIFFMLNVLGLMVSLSRIAMLSVILSTIVCFLLLQDRKPTYKKAGFAVGIIVVLILVLGLVNRQVFEHYSDTAGQIEKLSTGEVARFGSGRVYLYEKFVKLAVETPKNALVGVGPDCLFLYGRVSKEDKMKYPELEGIAEKAHSDPIEYASTMGIPALICYLFFIGSILYMSLAAGGAASPEFTAIFAGWLGYLIQSLFNAPAAGVVGIFYVFAAIICRLLKTAGTEKQPLHHKAQ